MRSLLRPATRLEAKQSGCAPPAAESCTGLSAVSYPNCAAQFDLHPISCATERLDCSHSIVSIDLGRSGASRWSARHGGCCCHPQGRDVQVSTQKDRSCCFTCLGRSARTRLLLPCLACGSAAWLPGALRGIAAAGRPGRRLAAAAGSSSAALAACAVRAEAC